MATMFPSKPRRGSTAGEVKLFNHFKLELPEDVFVYQEPNLKGIRPDYILIFPERGLLVLEVKDYYLTTLHTLTTDTWTLNTKTGITEITNPEEQARRYCYSAVNLLILDKNIWELDDIANKVFAYNYGVVFTNLSNNNLKSSGIWDVIDPSKALGKDILSLRGEDLLETLYAMFTVKPRNSVKLSSHQMNLIRYVLFPEIRVSSRIKKSFQESEEVSPVKIMDLEQETIARDMGDGPRMIKGPSGSGKTLILIARAKLLSSNNPDWNILVVNYNVVLSGKLSTSFGDDFPNVKVMSYFSFLKTTYGTYDESKDVGDPDIKWDAILIDEGQDFDPRWLNYVARSLKDTSSPLLLVMDMAQNINGRRGLLTKSGIDFRGRSQILKLAYRSSKEIQEFAWKFLNRFSNPDLEEVVEPQFRETTGLFPVVARFNTFSGESLWISTRILSMVRQGICNFEDIAVLYRVKKFGPDDYIAQLLNSLKQKGIPYEWVSKDTISKRNFPSVENSVKVITLESSKGLDFKVVFIMKADSMPLKLALDVKSEVNLFYVGMTRAMEYLLITFSGDSIFTKYLTDYLIRTKGD